MNKIIKSILIIGIVFSSMSSFSQGDKIKVKEFRSKQVQLKGADLFGVNGSKGGDLIILAKKRVKYGPYDNGRLTYLSKLNESMKIVGEVKQPQIFSNKRPNYVDLKKIGTKYLLFFTFNNKKAKKQYLFFVQIDPTDLSWYGKPFKIAELPVKTGRNVSTGYFDIEMSENGKFIIVTGINPSTVKGAKYNIFGKKIADGQPTTRSISFWLLNDDLKVVNHRNNFSIKSSGDANLIMDDFRCDNEGNVVVVARNAKTTYLTKSDLKKSKKKSSSVIEERSFKIMLLNNKGEDLEYETDKELFLTDLKIGFAPDKIHLDAVGIVYEDVGGVYVSSGVYTIRLLKSDLSEVLNEKTDFESEFIKKINASLIKGGKKQVSKSKSKRGKDFAKQKLKEYENGIPNLTTVVDVVYNKEGDISVLLEQYYLQIVTVTTTNGRTTTTTTYYIHHYGTLVMVSGLGNEEVEPVMGFIGKDDYSLTFYDKGVKVISKDGEWFLMSQNKIFKIDSESLKYSEYAVNAKSTSSGGSKMRKVSGGYSNSIFNQTYVLDNKEFIGVQYQSKKKNIYVKMVPN